MKNPCLFLFLLVGLAFTAGCKKPSSDDASKQEANQSNRTSQSDDGKAAIRLKTYSYIDRDGIGIEAFSVLVPSDWKVDGSIAWVLDNPGMPVRAHFRFWNPNGSEALETFPNQPFFWTNNQMLLQTLPVGAKYFGNEVRPMIGPIEALKEIILPRFRHGAQNLRITNQQLLPEVSRALKAPDQGGVRMGADAAKVRFEYQQDGSPMEEELCGVVESMSFPIQSMFGTLTNTNWYIDYLFSFKAKKGTLDKHTKLFQTMVNSFRINPQWFNKYNQVVESLIRQQIQHIRNIGELSRMISRTSNETSDMMMESYNQRQAVYDRVAENFSQHIRGVDAYYNPIEEKSVELPSGYRHAWTNSLGEYILTDQEDFNPNIGSNLNWQPMEKK